MASSRGKKIGIIIGIAGALVGVGIGLAPLLYSARPEPPREPLAVKLDTAGPYLILATTNAAKRYTRAIGKAQALHPEAGRADFDPADLAGAEKALRRVKPRYALVFIEPGELDVNFAWRWLRLTSGLDNDPFVDVRTGFITGATPEAAEGFVARTADAVAGRLRLPGRFVDDLGPPEQGDQRYFNTTGGSEFAPTLAGRLALRSVFHGKNCFTEDRLDALDGAGVVHFGGHGHPDRIDDGLTAGQLPRLKLSPCVVSSGACYTGVTRRWFDFVGGKLVEKEVEPADCFCLKLLETPALAYLAALHPDHGMPVYQELEYLAWRGGSLGDAMKNTHDGVVLGNGGKLPAFEPLKDGMARPRWTDSDVMLVGTASRVLFGDPALIVSEPFAKAPFAVGATAEIKSLRVIARLANPELKCWLTDTYHRDLGKDAPFNDRAVFEVELPKGWGHVATVNVVAVRAGGKELAHRLVGWAVEEDGGDGRLRVQVDLPAEGFQRSAFRVAGSTVELVVQRPD